MVRPFVSLDPDDWTEPYLKGACRCPRCFKDAIAYRFVNSVGVEGGKDARLIVISYQGKVLPYRFYDLWHAEYWVRMMLKVDTDRHAHINWQTGELEK